MFRKVKTIFKKVLEDFGCIDADYDFVAPYLIHFWNHLDPGST